MRWNTPPEQPPRSGPQGPLSAPVSDPPPRRPSAGLQGARRGSRSRSVALPAPDPAPLRLVPPSLPFPACATPLPLPRPAPAGPWSVAVAFPPSLSSSVRAPSWGVAAGEGRDALLGHPAPSGDAQPLQPLRLRLRICLEVPSAAGQRGLEGRLPPGEQGKGLPPPPPPEVTHLCLSGVAFPRWLQVGAQTRKETNAFLFSITGV